MVEASETFFDHGGEPKRKTIPYSGVESAEAGPTIRVTKEDFPWLESDSASINLAKVAIRGGRIGYIGSFHVGELRDIASRLNNDQEEEADGIFYARLPELIENGFHSRVFNVREARTRLPVRYIKNGNMRVYLMVADDLLPENAGKQGNERDRVIIRIATCSKDRSQNKVLKTITGRSKHTESKVTGV